MLNRDSFIQKYLFQSSGLFTTPLSTSCRGRLTKSHTTSIKNYFSIFGISFQNQLINFVKIFNRNAPLILEIGFGTGENLVNMALNHPEKNFLGIEVYLPGIASCLNQVYLLNIKNLKIICYNAVDVINNMISNSQLYQIKIFFPDPWPKKKHQKRRMLQPDFLFLLSQKLIKNGILHIATDWNNYAYDIINYIKNIDIYVDQSFNQAYADIKKSRIITKFEKKGQILGHKIFDLLFQKKN
ncbi:tRNA (guanine-N(7)-)-methyltransferase [Buchnera aphidicola (Eriosoma grossulariae)]|uniref:tRNA (guanosine(46)-N7)-methyltransferase TrmB n=1 Tax=Buchnera aphidicola TaxID=9 RepID=UPI003464E16B